MTRSIAAYRQLVTRLGRDLGLTWSGPTGRHDDADLIGDRLGSSPADRHRPPRRTTAPGPIDLGLVDGVDAARQLLVNRLMTRRGELAVLGHPTYGSRHHDLLGEPNTERTRNLVKVHVLEALRHEPRIAKVHRCAIVPADRHRSVVHIELDVELIGEPNPLNLIVPFEMSGP